MALDRILPAGTEDYAGDDYMDEVKGEAESIWSFATVPLDSVAGTDTITAAARVEITSYEDGMGVLLVPANSNTGPATLNVDSIGAKDILDYAGDPIGANALLAGRAYELRFFDGDDAFRILTGPGGFGNVESKAVVVANQQANGTAGGTATSGSWLTYPLNTAVLNELSGEGVSLASNVIEDLPAGTYDVYAEVPFNDTDHSRIRLWNVTDAAVIALAATTVRATTANEIKSATLCGRFTIAAAKDIRLEYRVQTTNADDGLGTAASFGEAEKYGYVKLMRPAEGGQDGQDAGAPTYREVTVAGDITVVDSDEIIGVNKASGAATNVNLGTAAARSGKRVVIKDIKKDASTNNITPVTSGGELIDGLAASNYTIAVDGGSFELYPRSGGWYTLT